jgi:HK97 family phage major capsid protein
LGKDQGHKRKRRKEMTLQELRSLIDQKYTELESMKKKIESEKRSANDDEKVLSNKLMDEIECIDAEVTSIETQDRVDAMIQKRRQPVNRPIIDDLTRADQQKKEFRSFGEQLQAVVSAGTGGRIDSRLVRAATGMDETIPSDGGFLVQTEYAADLLGRAYELAIIAPKCRKIPISGPANSIKINAIAETSRVTGSRWGGIQAYWSAEAGTKTPSAPKFRQMELSLKKLVGLCYSTDELLADASALQSVITQAFSDEFAFMMDDAVINGTGVGQPLGIMKSNALVVVNRAGAGVIANTDIGNMWARQWVRGMTKSFWFCNQDVLPAFFAMSMTVGTGGMPVYLPPGGLSQTPYSTLMGRPLIPIEQCQTYGTKGDLILADFGEYILVDKGGMTSASSIHVRFVNDETAFRFVYRVDGQPAWNAVLTPYKGSNTVSPWVVLS